MSFGPRRTGTSTCGLPVWSFGDYVLRDSTDFWKEQAGAFDEASVPRIRNGGRHSQKWAVNDVCGTVKINMFEVL